MKFHMIKLTRLLVAILLLFWAQNSFSFSPPIYLNNNHATDSGSDRHPQFSTDNEGNWIAVWQSYDTLGDTVGEDADILFATASDNGNNWTSTAPKLCHFSTAVYKTLEEPTSLITQYS